MEIICRTPNFYDELQLRHDGMKVTASTSAIKNGDKVIGAYVDKQGIPRNIYRNSDYGQQILLAYQDNRRFNPEAWTIRDGDRLPDSAKLVSLKNQAESYEKEILRYIELKNKNLKEHSDICAEITIMQIALSNIKDSIKVLEKFKGQG